MSADYTWEPELDRFIDTETGACTEWFTCAPDKRYKASFDLRTDMSRFIITLDDGDKRMLVTQGLLSLDRGVEFDIEHPEESQRARRWFLAGQMYWQWLHVRARLLYVKSGGA